MEPRSRAHWTTALFLALAFALLTPVILAGGGDDPGSQPDPPPTGEEFATVDPVTSSGWLFLLVSSTLGASAALALWRRL